MDKVYSQSPQGKSQGVAHTCAVHRSNNPNQLDVKFVNLENFFPSYLTLGQPLEIREVEKEPWKTPVVKEVLVDHNEKIVTFIFKESLITTKKSFWEKVKEFFKNRKSSKPLC